MKNFCIAILLSVLILAGSCKKESYPEIERDLDSKNLTECSEGNCNFSYSERKDLNGETVVPGRFRLFKTELTNGKNSVLLYIKAPMEGVAFTIDAEAISTSTVWTRKCPECRIAPVSPVRGRIRGIRIARDNFESPETWVLEVDLTLSTAGNDVSNKLAIKQVYFPESISPNET